jgi:nitrogen fixation/metabolism regulation signal transduction histidine kinase
VKGITHLAMPRFIHSLRFQLPAVLLGLFVLILGLWVLLFREISSITVKTRELNGSTEISDRVTEWSNHVATAARERTKFMTLSKEGYLDGFLDAAQGFEASYRTILELSPDGKTASFEQIKDYHNLNREYASRAQAYAWEWRNQEKLRQSLLQTIQTRGAFEVEAQKKALASASATKVASKPDKGKGKNTVKDKGKPKAVAHSKAKPKAKSAGPAKPNPQVVQARREKEAALASLAVLNRRKHQNDSASADAFKAIEGKLREGLQSAQATMAQERLEKQRSLQATIARAKQRLIYSLVLLTLMVGYVAYILQWKILEPLSLLENGAIQIGRGYLGFRVEVQSQSEIGDLAKVFNTMSDQLSHHRDSELRLKRLDAIQQVVRSVNHEINNPLMIISGNAEYLLTVLHSEDPSVNEKLNTIVSEVRRIFHVTQQLKEIKDLVTSNYTSDQDQMIDLARSSQVVRRAW